MQNEELKNVTEIMGLKHGVKYDETNIKTLRYGHIMIMADQDHDGSHIKGLIINFIHHFWPSLLDVSGFLEQFITPIVKATKSKKVLTFFTIPEYETWKKSLGDDARGWTIKYYKGLGTSTSSEAKEYFSNLDLHDIPFSRLSDDRAQEFTASMEIDEDAKPSALDATQRLVNSCGSDLIQMAFSKHQAADRKLWISSIHNKDTFFDYVSAQKNGGAKFSDFINRELVLFSQCDNLRSIPNLYDGFKPSQRKVMFACFLRNLRNEMKVVQLGGYVSEKSAYHHGETSLQNTIINLAQDYVGSNNINLLTPAGQFGTRRMGGSDAAR
jgi:DNA topoisomerase-2